VSSTAVGPVLDLTVLAALALLAYVGFRSTSAGRRFGWYADRVGLDRTVARGTWVAGVAGIYVAGQAAGDVGLPWLLLLGTYVLGLFYAAVAVSNRRPAAVTATAADGASTDRVSPGPAVVAGEAAPAGGTLTTPYAGLEAVCYRAVVTRTRDAGRSLIDRRTDRTRFAVTDRWGEVVVDPADARFMLDGGRTAAAPLGRATDDPDADLTLAAGEPVPDRLARALSDHAGLDVDGGVDVEVRIREYVLAPDDDAVAVGEAAAGTDSEGHPATVVETPPGRRSTVAAGALDAVADRLDRAARRHLRLGGALIVAGLGGALALGAA